MSELHLLPASWRPPWHALGAGQGVALLVSVLAQNMNDAPASSVNIIQVNIVWSTPVPRVTCHLAPGHHHEGGGALHPVRERRQVPRPQHPHCPHQVLHAAHTSGMEGGSQRLL